MLRFAGRLERFQADASRWGWPRSAASHFLSLLRSCFGFNIHWILGRDLVGHPLEGFLSDGLTLRVLEPEDLFEAAANPEMEMSADFVEGALARGDIAFGAFDRGRLVCYTWRALGATPDVEDVWVTFGAPYHYGYKAFTRPSHRGRRLLVAVSFFSDSYLLERGHAKRLTFTGICNFASLASQKAAGSRKIGIAGYIRLFGVFIPYRTSAVKAVGFAFVRKSDRPTRKG